jgi:hypothetical protein
MRWYGTGASPTTALADVAAARTTVHNGALAGLQNAGLVRLQLALGKTFRRQFRGTREDVECVMVAGATLPRGKMLEDGANANVWGSCDNMTAE